MRWQDKDGTEIVDVGQRRPGDDLSPGPRKIAMGVVSGQGLVCAERSGQDIRRNQGTGHLGRTVYTVCIAGDGVNLGVALQGKRKGKTEFRVRSTDPVALSGHGQFAPGKQKHGPVAGIEAGGQLDGHGCLPVGDFAGFALDPVAKGADVASGRGQVSRGCERLGGGGVDYVLHAGKTWIARWNHT